MTTTLRFIGSELPRPKPAGQPNIWGAVVDQLREHRGEWALIEEGVTKNRATSIYVSLSRWGVRPSQRSNGDGTFDVYARVLE